MSFPRYPAYKDSGVEWLGQVPAHWTIKKVSHLAHLMVGFPFSSESFSFDPEAGLPLVRGDNVTEGYLRWGEKGRYWPFDLDYEPRYLLQANDILVSMDGSKVGKNWAQLRESDLPALLVQRVTCIRVAPECTARFVYAQIANDMFIRYVDRTKTDPAIPHITMKNIGDYWVTVPPTDEQELIVRFLDREVAKIDALVAEQEQLITLLKEKRQAVISHAVTKGLDPSVPMKDSGVEWLGEVPAHWEVIRVKHLVKSFEQGWSPQCESFPVESESEWGVLKVGCVNGGIFNPEENKALPADLTPLPELGVSAGDLLISRANTRELVGSAAVALADHHNLMLCDKLYRLRLDQDLCVPAFLSLFLGTERARGQIELAATGASSSMLNISQSTILELSVALPPVAEQKKLLFGLEESAPQVDQLVKEAVLSIELLRERRSALISAAVTGQIDVRQCAQ